VKRTEQQSNKSKVTCKKKGHVANKDLYCHGLVNIFVGVFEKVRVSVIYTNCPSERYNQIVRRTVYIVEIVLESKNGSQL
jgi:hypothetical protein